MGQQIEYEWISDGVNVEVASTNIPDVNYEMQGYANLVGGRVTVQSYHAGKGIIITRIQNSVTAIGNLYIYAPATVVNVSFEIRSTNVNDNGTVYWQIVE